jgi:hypothetical protein
MLSAVVFAVVFALCTHVHVVWAQVLQGTIVPGEFFLSFFFFFFCFGCGSHSPRSSACCPDDDLFGVGWVVV